MEACRSGFLVLCLVIAPFSSGEVPQEVALEQIALNELSVSGSLRNAVDVICREFRVPLSFEWAAVNEDRSTTDYGTVDFSVSKGESLRSVLDRLVIASGQSVRWDRIHDVIYIRSGEDNPKNESLLDTRISVNVSGASTWEAFVELAKAVNSATSGDRFLLPVPMSFDEGNTPPTELRDLRTVNLNLKDVVARDAACAIVAASPLYMEIQYRNDYRPGGMSRPSARLYLWSFDSSRNLMSGPPRSCVNANQLQVWTDEARSALPERVSVESSTQND